MAKSHPAQPLGGLKSTTILCYLLLSIAQALPPSFNASLGDEAHPQCTPSQDWVHGLLNPNHCLDALQKFSETDYKLYRFRDIEFLAAGAKPRADLDTVRLPRKYTSESCTIVIAMLSTIHEHILPGQVRQADEYDATDQSKFSFLYSIAAWIDKTCVSKVATLGWCATGRDLDIGVFVVGTKSKVYHVLTRGLLGGGIDRDTRVGVDTN
ncbi:MAG: hypothetical protein Q9183_003194 [Haloplaca sp. 2 TL-2023]